ncbi:MAG TPA: class I SAM-dependent methyltransferase [Acidimicrobiales bacterium]|nr:class I SAM-dependent methyltransferase [Acidimicrobiales bacterium]
MNEGHLEFLASAEWAQMLQTDLWPWVESVGDLGDDVVEIGPGPGLTTDLLRGRVAHVTAVEVDEALAAALKRRLSGTNVSVVSADATRANLPSNRFSAATCFSMLHHMAAPKDQDALFEVLHRALRPGGIFVGADAIDIEPIRAGHIDDTFTPVPPETLPERLAKAGFGETEMDVGDYQFRFVARKVDGASTSVPST